MKLTLKLGRYVCLPDLFVTKRFEHFKDDHENFLEYRIMRATRKK
jgi:hypothetical protein